MYAIIETGGKQYKVSEGDILHVEKLAGEVGDKIAFDQILMLGGNGDAKLGTPLVDGAKVEGEIVRQSKAKKVIVFKKKRRQGYQKKQGHRQEYTEVKFTKVG